MAASVEFFHNGSSACSCTASEGHEAGSLLS